MQGNNYSIDYLFNPLFLFLLIFYRSRNSIQDLILSSVEPYPQPLNFLKHKLDLRLINTILIIFKMQFRLNSDLSGIELLF